MKNLYILKFLLLSSFIASAQQENSLYFDNIDDVVICPGASGLIANSNEISLTFWVYPQNPAPSYPDFDGFAGFRNNSDACFYILHLSPTEVEARFVNSQLQVFDIVWAGVQLNTWQHFALIYDGSTLTLYYNGVLGASIPASGTITTTTDPFYVGMLPWTLNNFYTNGKVDEVSLWDKALTASEITCMYTGAIDPTSANLQLYYRCNQGIAGGNNTTVTTLSDATGHINGNLTNFLLTGAGTSNWTDGVITPNSSIISDSICPGATYIFGSQTISQPGTYFEAFPSSGTCDSIVQLVLTAPVIDLVVSQIGPVLTSVQTGATYQWIDCLNGDSAIAGATSQTYTATANGQYAVIVTFGGCSDTSVCATVTNVGLNNPSDKALLTAANPFNEEVSILFPEIFRDETFEIYDATGRLVHSAIVVPGDVRINASGWSRGIYFLSVNGTGQRMKLVKN